MPHDNSEPDATSPPLLISTLGVCLNSRSRKEIGTVTLKAGDFTKEIRQTVPPGGCLQEQFDPPLEVLFGAKMSVSCRGSFRGAVSMSLSPREVLIKANEKDGKQVYCKTERNIEITIGIQSLPSTVSEVVASCSRFRVLIIGESGVGKSSLINKVFGVSGVDVSDTTRGEASIDQEHIACENDRFIVHDSCGFEAADHQNLEAVRNFISGRKCKRDLKDQLHAVWLCLAIPYAGGRVAEAGVEEFLRNRRDILGNIPLVVVFTKLDLLDGMLNTEALEGDGPLDDATLNERQRESLERLCLCPVRTAAGSESVSHVAVSTMEDYGETLAALVDETTKNIQKYVKDEAAHYIATIAQRVNISLKVALTMAIGEKRYWKALMASPNFRGRTMKECLNVLHKDIVTIWNFKDPEHCLEKDDFKAGLLNAPSLGVREIQDLQKTAQSSVAVIAAIVTIIAGIAGTGGAAIPIVVPVAAAIVLGKLAHDVYRSSQDVVRQLMAYIVDLTCVMQIVFLLTAVRPGRGNVTVEVVGMAMEAYERAHRGAVHADIHAFPVRLAVAPGKRDDVLEKIKELIRKYRNSDEQVAALRRQLQ